MKAFLVTALLWLLSNPKTVSLIVVGLWRTFAKTIRSGQVGVLYRLGRVRGVVGPGLNWLVPLADKVVPVVARATTIEPRGQIVAIADESVWVARTILVYRIEDPALALTEVREPRKACLDIVPLVAAEVLGRQTRATLSREQLDVALKDALSERLARWGIAVEQAGFSHLAPDPRTQRTTQLASVVSERAGAVGRMGGGPLAMSLVGTETRFRRRTARLVASQNDARRLRAMRMREERLRLMLARRTPWGDISLSVGTVPPA